MKGFITIIIIFFNLWKRERKNGEKKSCHNTWVGKTRKMCGDEKMLDSFNISHYFHRFFFLGFWLLFISKKSSIFALCYRHHRHRYRWLWSRHKNHLVIVVSCCEVKHLSAIFAVHFMSWLVCSACLLFVHHVFTHYSIKTIPFLTECSHNIINNQWCYLFRRHHHLRFYSTTSS